MPASLASVDINEELPSASRTRFGFESHSTDLDAVLAPARTWTPSSSPPPSTLARRAHQKALEAGKHVLVQKPMTASIEEAEAALTLAEKTRLKLMVSFFELFPCRRSSGRGRSSRPASSASRSCSRR